MIAHHSGLKVGRWGLEGLRLMLREAGVSSRAASLVRLLSQGTSRQPALWTVHRHGMNQQWLTKGLRFLFSFKP